MLLSDYMFVPVLNRKFVFFYSLFNVSVCGIYRGPFIFYPAIIVIELFPFGNMTICFIVLVLISSLCSFW
jgi:hypothetical protein